MSQRGKRFGKMDGGLRRRMQLLQGLQWLRAAQGDPFAALLRGHAEDFDTLNARLRLGDPVHRSDTGTWVVARYSTATELLAHPQFEARAADWRPTGVRAMALTQEDLGWGESYAALDVPQPSQLRAAVDRALAGLAGELDLAEVASRISIEVLADILGLPANHRDRVAELAPSAGLVMDSLLCPQGIAQTERMLDAVRDLRELLAGRDLLLAVVGVRVCTDLLLNALLQLLTLPANWAGLRADPGSAARIVTETVRHNPPVQVQLLQAGVDTEVEGRHIEAGNQVAVLLGAANRDPEVFAKPDHFDPYRTTTPLLPKWPGEFVLPLARAQAETAIAALATRFPGLTMSGPVLRRPKAPASRGVLRLPANA